MVDIKKMLVICSILLVVVTYSIFIYDEVTVDKVEEPIDIKNKYGKVIAYEGHSYFVFRDTYKVIHLGKIEPINYNG